MNSDCLNNTIFMMPVYIAAGMSTLFSYNNIMYAYLPTYILEGCCAVEAKQSLCGVCRLLNGHVVLESVNSISCSARRSLSINNTHCFHAPQRNLSCFVFRPSKSSRNITYFCVFRAIDLSERSRIITLQAAAAYLDEP